VKNNCREEREVSVQIEIPPQNWLFCISAIKFSRYITTEIKYRNTAGMMHFASYDSLKKYYSQNVLYVNKCWDIVLQYSFCVEFCFNIIAVITVYWFALRIDRRGKQHVILSVLLYS
jgi:hypothetical protein